MTEEAQKGIATCNAGRLLVYDRRVLLAACQWIREI